MKPKLPEFLVVKGTEGYFIASRWTNGVSEFYEPVSTADAIQVGDNEYIVNNFSTPWEAEIGIIKILFYRDIYTRNKEIT